MLVYIVIYQYNKVNSNKHVTHLIYAAVVNFLFIIILVCLEVLDEIGAPLGTVVIYELTAK